jgi:hypothetical protein
VHSNAGEKSGAHFNNNATSREARDGDEQA